MSNEMDCRVQYYSIIIVVLFRRNIVYSHSPIYIICRRSTASLHFFVGNPSHVTVRLG